LTEIGVEKNTTIIFPVPIDILQGIQALVKNQADANEAKSKSGA